MNLNLAVESLQREAMDTGLSCVDQQRDCVTVPQIGNSHSKETFSDAEDDFSDDDDDGCKSGAGTYSLRHRLPRVPNLNVSRRSVSSVRFFLIYAGEILICLYAGFRVVLGAIGFYVKFAKLLEILCFAVDLAIKHIT